MNDFPPRSISAAKALALAHLEACRSGHQEVSAAHVLLGLVRVLHTATPAPEPLRRLGLSQPALRTQPEPLQGPAQPDLPMAKRPLSASAEDVLAEAYRVAVSEGRGQNPRLPPRRRGRGVAKKNRVVVRVRDQKRAPRG